MNRFSVQIFYTNIYLWNIVRHLGNSSLQRKLYIFTIFASSKSFTKRFDYLTRVAPIKFYVEKNRIIFLHQTPTPLSFSLSLWFSSFIEFRFLFFCKIIFLFLFPSFAFWTVTDHSYCKIIFSISAGSNIDPFGVIILRLKKYKFVQMQK